MATNVANPPFVRDKQSQGFQQREKWNNTEVTIDSGSDSVTDEERDEQIPYQSSSYPAMNSVDSDTDEELDEQMLEVEDTTEKILKELCGYDVTENENQDDCVTMMVTVFKQHEEMVKSLIVCIAGVVPGVADCFEQIDQTVLNTNTLWIYNKDLRQSIEAEWKTKKEMTVTLPHKAFTSPDLKESLPMDSADNLVSFTLDNMRVKYFSPDKTHTSEWRWIVELMPGEAASGRSPKWTSGSASNTEHVKDDPKLRKEVDEKIEKFKKASSYQGVTEIDTSSDKLESSKIIATISLSRDDKAGKGALKSLVILSLGEQSQFIYPDEARAPSPYKTQKARTPYDEMVIIDDVKTRKCILGPFRYWGMYTCEVKGERVKALEKKIRKHWDENITQKEGRRLNNDMACHSLYVEGQTQFEIMINKDDQKVVYVDLDKKVIKERLYHITVWSHLPRDEALRDHMLEINSEYKGDWEKVSQDKLTVGKFIETYSKSLEESQEQVVSFQYPTIQLGFQISRNYKVRFGHKGTTHHKFHSPECKQRIFKSHDYLQFLKKQAEQPSTKRKCEPEHESKPKRKCKPKD